MAGIEDLRLSLEISPWSAKAKFPWSEHKYPGKWKTLIFWSHASFWATQFLVLQQWKHKGAQGKPKECVSSWQSKEDFALCLSGGKCPWSQEHHNDQPLALKFWQSPAVWGGALERAVEVDGTSQWFIPRKAFLGASQLDPPARNVRTQSPHLFRAILFNAPTAPIGWS